MAISSVATCARCHLNLCALPPDLLHFVRLFLHVGGNLRKVERRLGLSYPTVEARLAAVNTLIDVPAADSTTGPDQDEDRLGLLCRFRDGELSLEEVVSRLCAEGIRLSGDDDRSQHA